MVIHNVTIYFRLTNLNISSIIRRDPQGFEKDDSAAPAALAVFPWIFEHESPPFWELLSEVDFTDEKNHYPDFAPHNLYRAVT